MSWGGRGCWWYRFELVPLFGSAVNPRRTDAGTYLCVRLISRGYICQSDFPILEFSSRGCIKLIGRHEQLGKGKENDWSSKSKVAKLSSGCWESDSLPVLPLLPWLRGVTLVFHAGLHVYCVCSPNLWVGFGSPACRPPDLWCGDGVRSHLVWKNTLRSSKDGEIREVCGKSKWKFKMAFAIRRPPPPPP